VCRFTEAAKILILAMGGKEEVSKYLAATIYTSGGLYAFLQRVKYICIQCEHREREEDHRMSVDGLHYTNTIVT
jgi:hypothetical protein